MNKKYRIIHQNNSFYVQKRFLFFHVVMGGYWPFWVADCEGCGVYRKNEFKTAEEAESWILSGCSQTKYNEMYCRIPRPKEKRPVTIVKTIQLKPSCDNCKNHTITDECRIKGPPCYEEKCWKRQPYYGAGARHGNSSIKM